MGRRHTATKDTSEAPNAGGAPARRRVDERTRQHGTVEDEENSKKRQRKKGSSQDGVVSQASGVDSGGLRTSRANGGTVKKKKRL